MITNVRWKKPTKLLEGSVLRFGFHFVIETRIFLLTLRLYLQLASNLMNIPLFSFVFHLNLIISICFQFGLLSG